MQEQRTCATDGCGEPLPVRHGPGRPRQYCIPCATKRNNATKPGRKRIAHVGRVCAIDGCEASVDSRDWCRKHYCRWLRHGDPLRERPFVACSEDDCAGVVEARGLCHKHYQRWQRRLPGQRAKQAAYDRTRRDRSGSTHTKRVRRYGVASEVFDKEEIYDRGGYRCQICGRKTMGVWPGRRSPTLDHIVPMSQGGGHVRSNVRCACACCNLAKGTRASNDQLLLDFAA